MTEEEWRPVVGAEGLYEVSNMGRVRSLDRRVPVRRDTSVTRLAKGRVLKGVTDSTGHIRVYISSLTPRSQAVHRLVCRAFHGPAPEGKPNVLHWDDNPSNNRADNLRWGSQGENIADIVRNGNHYWANKTHCKRGHDLSGENIYENGRGRTCKKCVYARQTVGLVPDDPRHGSNAGYISGCRCEACTGANREYGKLYWRKKHGQGIAYRD